MHTIRTPSWKCFIFWSFIIKDPSFIELIFITSASNGCKHQHRHAKKHENRTLTAKKHLNINRNISLCSHECATLANALPHWSNTWSNMQQEAELCILLWFLKKSPEKHLRVSVRIRQGRTKLMSKQGSPYCPMGHEWTDRCGWNKVSAC